MIKVTYKPGKDIYAYINNKYYQFYHNDKLYNKGYWKNGGYVECYIGLGNNIGIKYIL